MTATLSAPITTIYRFLAILLVYQITILGGEMCFCSASIANVSPQNLYQTGAVDRSGDPRL